MQTDLQKMLEITGNVASVTGLDFEQQQNKYKDHLVLVLVRQIYLEKEVLEICLVLKLVQLYQQKKQ